MKHKNLYLAALILVAVAQITIPMMQIFTWNDILSNGKEYRFLVAPADPRDPFRGAYIKLNFRDNHWDILPGRRERRSKRIYVWLSEDAEGYAIIDKVTYHKPADSVDYVSALIDHEYDDAEKRRQIQIKYSFDQYFLSSEKAERAERDYFDALLDTTNQVYARVRVKSGTGLLEGVMINGTPLEEK